MRGRREGAVRLCELFAETKDNVAVLLVKTLYIMVVRMVLKSAYAILV